MKLNVTIRVPGRGQRPSAHVGFQLTPELESAFWSLQSLRSLGSVDDNMEIIWKIDRGLVG